MCRESFVVHREFIEDLPEEYKATFLMYAYDYGIKGIVPELSGLEKSLWVKIQRRIDYDSGQWEEAKLTRSEAGRLGGKKSGLARRAQTKQNEANEATLQSTKQNEANEAVYVSVTDDVSGNVPVSVTGNVTVSENLSAADAPPTSGATLDKPKKAPLTEREPANDFERVEKAYFEQYKKLYDKGVFNSPQPDINYGQCRKLEREKIKKFGLESVLLAINRGADDDFCVQKGYSLSMILSAGIFNSLLNGNDWKRNRRAIDEVDAVTDEALANVPF